MKGSGLRGRVWSVFLLPTVVGLVVALAWVSVRRGGTTASTERLFATVAAVCVAGALIIAGRQAARVVKALDGVHRSQSDGSMAGQLASQVAGQWVDRFEALTAEGQKDIGVLLEQIGRGERPQPYDAVPQPVRPGDRFAEFEHTLRLYHRDALNAVATAAARQQVDVFVNIAQRLHALVNRALSRLDTLESEVEDPDLLGGLFGVDHLVTQFRRQVESLAVMGGAVPRRISRPVPLPTVLRQAVAEIEQYARVRVVQPPEGTLPGHAAAEVIHLLAELVENAAKFSPPETQVTVRAEQVPAGLAVEIDDRGLPMAPDKLELMNQLLATPDRFDIRKQLEDGRIGLFVVAQIARRHSINITLRKNIYGGNQAVVVLPTALIAGTQAQGAQSRAADAEVRGRQPVATAASAHAPAHAAPAHAAPAQYGAVPATGGVPLPTEVPAGAGRQQVQDPVSGRDLPKRRATPHPAVGSAATAAMPQEPAYQGQSPQENAYPEAPPVQEPQEQHGDGRPSLPKRSENFRAPDLPDLSDAAERQVVPPNPDLMARFTSGIRLASAEDGTPDGSGGTR
jgi:signal transduction histidine kinase